MNQSEYIVEQLAKENARLTVELHKANFAVIALQEKLESTKKEESKESEEDK